jgi:DNA mismatch repair ATPase MutL
MAIPQGKMLTDIEMRDLVERWLHTYTSRRLPNGQTIVTLLTHEEIQKRF